MACLYPHSRSYIDPVSGEVHSVVYPCGHCINCLHAQQDSWLIRIDESCKHAERREFIYDTLTFSPANVKWLDVTDEVHDPLRKISDYSRKCIDYFSQQYTRLTGEIGRKYVCYVERDFIRDWIRRGRELFVYHHGYRPRWKYIIFQEYGPQTSRIHFHLVFFNISHGDYVKYLAKPWRREVGFTRTKCVSLADPSHRGRICRYISKYVGKGCFESPLVKEGFLPKPFRCISHGIGEEYLKDSKFDFARTYMAGVWKSIKAPKFNSELGDYVGETGYRTKYLINDVDILEGFKNPSSQNLRDLVLYYDSNGFPHALPRYYRYKLTDSLTPNLYSYAIQNLLLARFELYRNQKMAEYARSLGFSTARGEAPSLGLPSITYDMVCAGYVYVEACKAKNVATRRYIKLKNHYLRPTRSKDYAWAS